MRDGFHRKPRVPAFGEELERGLHDHPVARRIARSTWHSLYVVQDQLGAHRSARSVTVRSSSCPGLDSRSRTIASGSVSGRFGNQINATSAPTTATDAPTNRP